MLPAACAAPLWISAVQHARGLVFWSARTPACCCGLMHCASASNIVSLPLQEATESEGSRNGDAGTSSSREHGRRNDGSSDSGDAGANRSGTGSNGIVGGVELGPIALSFKEDQRDDRHLPRLRMHDHPCHPDLHAGGSVACPAQMYRLHFALGDYKILEICLMHTQRPAQLQRLHFVLPRGGTHWQAVPAAGEGRAPRGMGRAKRRTSCAASTA